MSRVLMMICFGGVAVLTCVVTIRAAGTTESLAVSTTDAASLSLDEAVRLSLIDQPILRGREATIAAQEAQAIAAAQLPDPKLSTGLRDLPINTRDAFSLRRDNFTELTVGISQELPRANKRRLLGARLNTAAELDRSALADDQQMVRRDVTLAWLDVYVAEQSLSLAREMSRLKALQLQDATKDYENGKSVQADWYAAKVDTALRDDAAHDWLHHVEYARAELARWIGDAAAQRPLRPLPSSITMIPNATQPVTQTAAASLPAALQRVETHPQLQVAEKQIDLARTEVALAKQRYYPDLTVEGYVAYRQDFADFVGLQISVDLPLFPGDRQDRQLAAAQRLADASSERKSDISRKLHAETTQRYTDWVHYSARAKAFAEHVVPTAQRQIEAARSAYGAGRGNFSAVLRARLALLDVQMQQLALAVESARAAARLQYLVGEPQ